MLPFIPAALAIGKLTGPAKGLPTEQKNGINIGNILTSPFRPRGLDLSPIDTNYEDDSKTNYTLLAVAFLSLLLIGGGFAYFITRK